MAGKKGLTRGASALARDACGEGRAGSREWAMHVERASRTERRAVRWATALRGRARGEGGGVGLGRGVRKWAGAGERMRRNGPAGFGPLGWVGFGFF